MKGIFALGSAFGAYLLYSHLFPFDPSGGFDPGRVVISGLVGALGGGIGFGIGQLIERERGGDEGDPAS